ncbi:hypothetical protein FOL47_009177 [Perkinsus chesapeaki]|uniref:SWIM-type domain-containing protein n=1 Tax=Perkinsus chesapeaki TaxID=330153 RepID=A0A7J6LA50_PERCH|nr:hypothetical protein FOL47_009177 [Perkinsus chesapeaki]
MGTVVRIYNDESHHPTVIVDFDNCEQPIHVKRESMIVRTIDGKIVFERRQIPLTACYAVTAHKVVGATLAGVWGYLSARSVKYNSRTAHDVVARFWEAPWLQGVAYTVLSRVPGAEYIKVFPLKSTLENSKVWPIFTMDAAALRFDKQCSERNWLSIVPPTRGPDTTDQPASGESINSDNTITHLAERIDALGDELRKFKFIMMASQNYAMNQHSMTGDPTNPVYYCAARPQLIEKVESMPIELQMRFFELLHEKLNLTFPKLNQESLDQVVDELADNAASGSFRPTSNGSRGNECHEGQGTSDAPEIRPSQGCPDQDESIEIHEEHTSYSDRCSQSDSNGDISLLLEDPYAEPDELSDHTNGSSCNSVAPEGLEVPVRPDDPPAGETRFLDEPYAAYEGALREVVALYLADNDHFRLMHTSLDGLRARQTCYLECQRTVGSRNAGKPAAEGGKPDWRSWEAFTCPLREVRVQEREGYTYFYALRDVQASATQWKDHAHFPGTTVCRSKTIPPDIVDDWIMWLQREPILQKKDLEARSLRKNLEGSYSSATMEFLTNKGLKNYEAVRQVLRSIKESKSSGLSVFEFCRRLERMAISMAEMRTDISETIRSLLAVSEGRHTPDDLTHNILCEPGPAVGNRRGVKAFSAVVTSARMLCNLENCRTIGLDATFNITHADLAVGVVCSLPRTSTAQPVALIIMNKESSSCLEHGLRELSKAAHAAGLGTVAPEEAVLDGSGAIHKALVDCYGRESVTCKSCYFHVMQNAKVAKGKSRLSGSLWLEVKKDLNLMGESGSRGEWLELRDLFMKKWSAERPPRLTESERSSLEQFLRHFKGYFDPSDWRSFWGTYGGETEAPRTNNSVERLNKELKGVLIPNRQRLTLNDLTATLEDAARWAMVSQYGRDNVRGETTEKLVKGAADHYLKGNYCEMPRLGVEDPYDRWLFSAAKAGRSSRLLQNASFDELMCSSLKNDITAVSKHDYSNLAEAHRLKKLYSVVRISSVQYEGETARCMWCTCHQWSLGLTCSHVLCLKYALGEENRSQLRRRGDGQLDEQTLPNDIRYGLRRKRARTDLPGEFPSGKERQLPPSARTSSFAKARW